MSHVTRVKTQLKNLEILEKACRALKIPFRCGAHRIRLYSGTAVAVASFELPEWRYPVAVEADGSLAYDNYNGGWGEVMHLNRLKQEYVFQAASEFAVRQGGTVSREHVADGTQRIRVQLPDQSQMLQR